MIPSSAESNPEPLTLARLLCHAKQNNIAYLLASLIAYQMGILNLVFEYGGNICG
jgi:hypothetical protein